MVTTLNGDSDRFNNANAAAAPSHQSHGKHYCVGMAWNPFRTVIFENRMTCDTLGWTTMVSFCVPKNIVSSKSMFKVDGCVGVAHNPYRGMYFKGHKNCNRDGWTHDFELPLQDTTGPIHHMFVWDAPNPHCMTFSPADEDL
ncbi:hypothetical protein BGZ73_004266 [Actinomortierella ambigua]|nr:hypothetical protein BGZ73_004266 [Actinomortierella ambigua]